MLLTLICVLAALAAPAMFVLEVCFGYNFPVWSFVAPVSVAFALFIAVIAHTLDGDKDD